MTRGRYLDALTDHLRSLSDWQVKEIVAEIYAHFEEGLAAGYEEEKIAEHLGSPKDVAEEYLKLYKPDGSAQTERGPSPLRMFGEEPYRESWDIPLQENEELSMDIAHIEVNVAAADVDSLIAEFDGYRVADANGEAPRIKIRREGSGVAIEEEYPSGQSAGWIARILSNVPRLRGKLNVTIPRKIGEVRVDLKSGVISINGANVDKLSSEVRSGSLSVANMMSGGDIGMEIRSGKQKIENLQGKNVEIDVKSGLARINGLSGESVKMEVSSGKIEGRAVMAQEEMEMTVKSGEMALREASAKNLRIETHSGSASVQNLTADAVCAEVSSGSIHLRLTREADAELSVRSGSMDLQMPKGEGFTYETDARSGSVQIRFDDKREDYVDKDRGRGHGVVGNGARKVKAEALSGSIQISQG